MLKIDKETQDRMEAMYPGIGISIQFREQATLPACAYCGSKDTAGVGCGVIGRTINLAAATTKFKLTPNGHAQGRYFCNACGTYFNEVR